MYHCCNKYYHCTCAKSVGFIRDLESMRLENSDTYIPPYCLFHLEKRVDDCHLKERRYRECGEQQKANHFRQMEAAYKGRPNHTQSSFTT